MDNDSKFDFNMCLLIAIIFTVIFLSIDYI